MHPETKRIIDALDLAPHPEGGFYKEMHRGELRLELPRGARAAHTAIYFLLPAGTFSALHRVASDEVWHYYDGDPLSLHRIDQAGAHTEMRLGRDIARGERPQCMVPSGAWQAAVPSGERHSLLGCTVAPGFDFADFEMPSRDELLARFPQHAALVTKLTRP